MKSWIIVTLNLGEHVIMYYYYYATSRGAKIWWKKYLTIVQIAQFIIDIVVNYMLWTLFSYGSDILF